MKVSKNKRVLVAIINNKKDFEIARSQGWYRIPVKKAPKKIKANYLAFYLTKIFGEKKWKLG